jgi:hypothetical protein
MKSFQRRDRKRVEIRHLGVVFKGFTLAVEPNFKRKPCFFLHRLLKISSISLISGT